jgi:hypothetical protein
MMVNTDTGAVNTQVSGEAASPFACGTVSGVRPDAHARPLRSQVMPARTDAAQDPLQAVNTMTVHIEIDGCDG